MLSDQTRWHLGLAAAQVFVVTFLCWSADIWSAPEKSQQFPGHLGPSAFIMAHGVTAMCCDWPWRKRATVEGKLSITAAVVYVTAETALALVSKGHRLANFYVRHGLHAWMSSVIGVCGLMLLLAPKLDDATGSRMKNVPHMWFCIAWAWFIYNHKQPNDYGVNLHWSATVWILVGGALRISSSSTKESGVAYIMAAYTFFGGQMGLTMWAAENKANIGSYVLIWHAIPMLTCIAYARVFCMAKTDGRPRDREDLDTESLLSPSQDKRRDPSP